MAKRAATSESQRSANQPGNSSSSGEDPSALGAQASNDPLTMGVRLARSTEAARHVAVHIHQLQRELANLPPPEAAGTAASGKQAKDKAIDTGLENSDPTNAADDVFRSFPTPDKLLVYVRFLRPAIEDLSKNFTSDLLWLLAGLLYPHGYRHGAYRAASVHEFIWRLGSMELEWILEELEEMCASYVPPVVRDGRTPRSQKKMKEWIAKDSADNAQAWPSSKWDDYRTLLREAHAVVQEFAYRRVLIALDCEHGAGRRVPSFHSLGCSTPTREVPPVLRTARHTKIRILRAVRDIGPCHYSAVAKRITVNKERVGALAPELLANGLLKREPDNNRGRTSITPAGLDFLARAEASEL